MANKRNLKKLINYICSDLFSECIATSLYNGNKNQDDVNSILTSILIIHNNYIKRVSHPEPGMKPKVYYKDLKNRFNDQVSETIDNIANL
ncbi:MAG: hypothetical protein Q4D41_02580 [Prevotellaceae bacterium]|nr:hypothetical protein [Prevotellaceae bacterium]